VTKAPGALFERLVVAVETLAARPLLRSTKATGIYNTRSELRAAIWKMHAQGYTGKVIAETVGVSTPTVSRILHGDNKQDNG
jgi:DNA-binding MarR family transcriptional regulator